MVRFSIKSPIPIKNRDSRNLHTKRTEKYSASQALNIFQQRQLPMLCLIGNLKFNDLFLYFLMNFDQFFHFNRKQAGFILEAEIRFT